MAGLTRDEARRKRHKRVRKNVTGTTERPRLSVYRSNMHIYAQIIDDTQAVTIAAASTVESDVRKAFPSGNNAASAAKVGELVAARAKEQGISTVVFDRGGYLYHGQVKALAEAAREHGLAF